MMPVLYTCPFFTIYTYGVFVAVAFLLSTWLLTRAAARYGYDENAVYNLCVVLLVGGIVSARILYVVLNWSDFYGHWLEIFKLQHGGLVWFGGFVGAVVCSLVYLKLRRMPIFATLGFFAPYIALAQAIGRIGCFFNGCCYGHESSWGVYFSVHGRVLVPTQLISSFSLLSIYVILRFLQERWDATRVFASYLMLAGLQRFTMEFMRADERPYYFSLSVFQWISLGLLAAGVAIMLVSLWKKKLT